MVDTGVRSEDVTDRIILPVSLDASAAEDLLRSFRDHLATGRSMTLVCDAVEYVGTPCLQVLVAAARDVRGRGGRFRLVSLSPSLDEAIATLGLRAELVTEGSA